MPRTLIVLSSILLSVPMSQAAGPAVVGDKAFLDSVNAVSARAKAGSAALKVAMDEGQLLDLLKDRDPEVRKAALVNARDEMGIHTNVRERVLQMASDAYETTEVRREAARTLYWISNMPEAREKLLSLAQRDREVPVRVMAYKALYLSCINFNDIRDEVLSAAQKERDPEVRRAAIWALFDSNGDPDVVRGLSDIASSRYEDHDVRIEAVKSLFLAMNRSEVRDMMKGLASNAYEDGGLRAAAVYALHASKWDSDVQRLLEDLSRGYDQDLKLAAVRALGDDDLFFQAYFHLGKRTNPHHYVPPIVDE